EKVFVHCFMDARDVPPSSGKDYVKQLMDKLQEIVVCKISTAVGRHYAMDGDNGWAPEEKAYAVIVYGEAGHAGCPPSATQNYYDKEVTDEFVVPTVVQGAEPISAGDSVIFYNFRPDRAREITRTLVDPDFTGFERKKGFFPLT